MYFLRAANWRYSYLYYPYTYLISDLNFTHALGVAIAFISRSHVNLQVLTCSQFYSLKSTRTLVASSPTCCSHSSLLIAASTRVVRQISCDAASFYRRPSQPVCFLSTTSISWDNNVLFSCLSALFGSFWASHQQSAGFILIVFFISKIYEGRSKNNLGSRYLKKTQQLFK